MITGHCHCYQIVEKHERIIFNSLNEYVEENKLLSTRGVFLDMPKAFALIEPQGSILGPLFFLICIIDLSDDLVSTVKLFAVDTSLFSVVHGSNISANELNNDKQKVSEWAYKWKTSFNADLNKQGQEVIFPKKLYKSSHAKIVFNSASVVYAY